MSVTLLKNLLLPPALPLLLLLLAGLLAWRWRRLALSIALLGWLALCLLSMPAVSVQLFVWLEKPYLYGVDAEQLAQADAIVVLGAGRKRRLPEYAGQDQVSPQGLWRLRYAARLAKTHDLPVVVSGGTPRSGDALSEAAVYTQVLREDFGLTQLHQEDGSRNTWQNAQQTAQLLARQGYQQVILVTHAYHMRRAQWSFAQSGVDLLPMATGFISTRLIGATSETGLDKWMPSMHALHHSRIALHEFLGMIYYALALKAAR